MASVRYTPRAERDLREIWQSIAIDNETAADALLLRIMEKLELAATRPQMGSPRPELSPTARLLVEGRYLAIYEPAESGMLVIAIVLGMRDPSGWLN